MQEFPQSVPFAPMTNCYGPQAPYLWLIPVLPILAAGVIALLKQRRRRTAAALSIGSLSLSLVLSLIAFAQVLREWANSAPTREVVNFTWLQFGATNVDLGWVLDPLSAVMLVMVTFVGLLIFIYSVGYMEHDENFTRFFCFLSLFAGAMLGVVIANSLLLLFMCWELVGLTSYLLIGFWYQKPSAAAAAKKAFLTTRVGDVFFLLGIVWLFAQTGTLLVLQRWRGLDGARRAGRIAGATGRSGTDGGRRDWPADLCRSGGQERPVSAACLAAGCDGRPHAGLRADSRGDHGGRGRLSDGAGVSADAGRSAGWRDNNGADGGDLGRRVHGGLCRAHRRGAERHQAHSGLLDRFATRIHDGRPGHGRRGGGHVPPDHPRLLQGAAVHGRGLGDSRLPRGAGHPPHGRPEVRHAADLSDVCDRNAGAVRISAGLLRLLEQGRHSGGGAALERWRGRRSTCWSLARC